VPGVVEVELELLEVELDDLNSTSSTIFCGHTEALKELDEVDDEDELTELLEELELLSTWSNPMSQAIL